MERGCYTIKDLQEILGIKSRKSIYQLLESNPISYVRLGEKGKGPYRISKASFHEWLNNRI